MTWDAKDRRSDIELLECSRNGDRDAFGQLVGRHYITYIRISTCILRDPAEAEDAVQQAMAKAFAHLYQYLGEAEFFAWMLRIVVNECRMLMRTRKRTYSRRLNVPRCEGENRPMEVPAMANDPEVEAINKDMIRVLQTEIRHIPPLLRQVILLRDIDQLPMPDVAEQLGITVAAAKSRLLRARGELRKRILHRFGHATHMMPVSTTQILGARVSGSSGVPAYIC
ncbi:MAG: sigma-70 family RNA polymerase sigma factor [Acidobacteriaceae bacterium]|nr:sigma-70 family RNA polymerase sigma factor [Acidobacteriaceae bacterium]